MSDLTELTDAARAELIARKVELGLDVAEVEVVPVLNWGGFVNRSFDVRARGRRYHLKLSSDPHSKRGLEQWWALRAIIEIGYHAPRMLAWLDLPGTPFSGPLFEWCAGWIPKELAGNALDQMTGLLDRLHRDQDLRQKLLDRGHVVGTCVAAYLDGHHRRFTEDLDYIESAPPPFIGSERIRWMWAQVRLLEEEIRASAAFAEPADAPTHHDLWLDNLLVSETGSVTVLDWDDLGLGDPVMDWAMLFGPSRHDLRPATVRAGPLPARSSGTEQERLELWARATLLDWIIDPLSDWVGAASEPEH